MGERLVVEIKRNNNTLATAYYHWSAYTKPAINILDLMHNHVLSKADDMTDDELLLAIIRFAEHSTGLGYIGSDEEKQKVVREFEEKLSKSGKDAHDMLEFLFLSNGGLNPQDREFAEKKFPGETFTEDVSRNEGLIDITEKTMQSALDWAEWITTVDLDEKKVFGNVVYEYDVESYLAETEDDDEEYRLNPNDIPKSPINLSDFSFDEIEIVKDVINITQSEWIRYGDTIYQIREG